MKIAGNIPIREVEERYINIQPIQAAGRLTAEAMKALIVYGDGYSTCDQCRKPFRLDKITKPPIAELSLIHISEPTRLMSISYAVFCLKKKKKNTDAKLTINT